MALTIGELVGYIRADGSDFNRNLARSQLRMEGFRLDVNGRLRDIRGRFVNEAAVMGRALADGFTDAERAGTRIVTVYNSVADAQSRTLRQRLARIRAEARHAGNGIEGAFSRVRAFLGNLDLGRLRSIAGSLGGVAMAGGRIAATFGTAAPAAAALLATVQNLAPAAAVAVTGLLAVQLATTAVKIGMSGVQDAVALAFDPSKAEEFAKALKKLSPNARAFVLELKGMSGQFAKLKRDVQDKLFEGLDKSLQGLAKHALPDVKRGLVDAAGAVNEMARGVGKAGTDLGKSGTLGKGIDSANKGLYNLSRVPGQIVTALGQMAAAAGPSFERLTKKAGEAFDRVSKRLGKSFESGGMQRAIERAIDLFGDLWDVAKNVGRIVDSIFGAAAPEGGGLIGMLKDITGELAKAFESPKVQRGLESLFSLMGKIGETAGPLFAQALEILAPILEELGPPLEDFVEKLGEGLKPILDQLVETGLLEKLAEAVGEFFDAIGPLLPELGELVSEILPHLIPLVEDLTWVLREAGNFIETWVAPAIRMLTLLLKGDFAGAWDYAKSKAEDWYDNLDGLLVAAGMGVFVFAKNWIRDMTSGSGTAKENFIRNVREGMERALDRIRALPGQAKSALAGIGRVLYTSGRALIVGFIEGMLSMVPGVSSAANRLTQAAKDFFPSSPAKKGPFSGRGYPKFSGRALADAFGQGIRDGVPGIESVLNKLPSVAASFGGMGMGGLGLAGPGGLAMGYGALGAYPQGRQDVNVNLRLRVDGSDGDMVQMIRKWVDEESGGNVQAAFGRRGK